MRVAKGLDHIFQDVEQALRRSLRIHLRVEGGGGGLRGRRGWRRWPRMALAPLQTLAQEGSTGATGPQGATPRRGAGSLPPVP